MKAIKKPIVIDFIPYSYNLIEVGEWVRSFGDKFSEHFIVDMPTGDSSTPILRVKTLEGTSYEVTTDDMVIRGINGEYYPCKKDIFYKTYDVCQE